MHTCAHTHTHAHAFILSYISDNTYLIFVFNKCKCVYNEFAYLNRNIDIFVVINILLSILTCT